MQVRWFGQSAFRLVGAEHTVMIDPFGALDGLAARGIRFDYPPITGITADLLLVTHEHSDHNGVEVVGGAPQIIRSTAGTLESPVGEVIGVASEHDQEAGIRRGPNTIFCFSLDGIRVCHFGDFGQADLRPEQQAAIGRPDLLFLPVGGGPTIGAELAAEIASRLGARVVVPMHYRTEAISFLEPADAFLDRFESVVRFPGAEFDTDNVGADAAAPTVAVPAVPA